VIDKKMKIFWWNCKLIGQVGHLVNEVRKSKIKKKKYIYIYIYIKAKERHAGQHQMDKSWNCAHLDSTSSC
jgi:hypothetical protein